MDPRELEALAVRLGENANDTEALNAAYTYGMQDPRSYAVFLEKAGAASPDPTMGAHWFCEAANVWTASLNDAHRAERALIRAIDKDPLSATATERLVSSYREKDNAKGIAALHARRAKGVEKDLAIRPDLRFQLAEIYAELGRVFVEDLSQPDRAIEAYKRAAANNPSDAYSIYQARELLKAANRLKEAVPLFAAEQALIQEDLDRRAVLYADEVQVCRLLGDNNLIIQALRGARSVDQSDDPTLKQQLAATILELVQAGQKRPQDEVHEAVTIFVELAETYDGEHGHSYALCALGLDPGNDRAAQLAMYYAEQIGRENETAHPVASYLAANPDGAVADQARELIAAQLSAGIDPTLVAALTPAADASPETKASAFSVIARAMATHGQDREAQRYFTEVVQAAPGDEEAVLYLANSMRGKRHRELRDLLMNAAKVEDVDVEQRRAWLSEAAELCEGPLRDVDGAIEARGQLVFLDPSDDEAADQLEEILEKSKKWDDLAELILRRAEFDDDIDAKVARAMRAAEIHRNQRGDNFSAGNAYAWLVLLDPENVKTGNLAVDYFVAANRNDRAEEFLQQLLASGATSLTRANYGRRFGELLEQAGKILEAAGAFAEAASEAGDAALWARAQACFVQAQAWEQAARSASERRVFLKDVAEQAVSCSEQATYLARLGDTEGALACLRRSLELNPADERVAALLEKQYIKQERFGELVSLCLDRATALKDPQLRLNLRKRAAFLQRDQLHDIEGMRQALVDSLADGEDAEVLRVLADDAESLGDRGQSIDYLRRLTVVLGGASGADVALRLAKLLTDDGDETGALEQYEFVLKSNPKDVDVLWAVAELQRKIGDETGSVETHRVLLPLAPREQKLVVARSLAELLASLHRPDEAVSAYKVVLALDPEDLEAVERLATMAEAAEQWEDFAEYHAQLVEVEGDEQEASRMALKLSEVLHVHLNRSDEALKALVSFARAGDTACREEYERLGDSLGRQGVVAASLVEWMKDAPAGPVRNRALRRAYERFTQIADHPRAIDVGLELVRMKGASQELAKSLEETAAVVQNIEALQAAFSVLGGDISGPPRAEEMVRQAEVLALSGMDVGEAVLHGEQALTSIDPSEVEPLLARLAEVAGGGAAAVGVYERQVTRCKSSDDRTSALCRAAEVASKEGDTNRVRRFFELALEAAGQTDGLDDLRARVKRSDEANDTRDLREALCTVLSEGGKGARDGGRSRSAYLMRAASVAHEDLEDADRGFDMLGQALVAHVDDEGLEQLVAMGETEGDLTKVVRVIGTALEQVHDGPLVRMLLRCRFDLLSNRLDDLEGAGEDLKKLYELSPADGDIASQLENMYKENNDMRGLVQLYEDQILRGRDQNVRGDLARKVALLWQDTLDEPREAADAWRRVLRMNSGDEEAKEGLSRAKNGMRRVSTTQIAAAEEETRKEVEARAKVEATEASRLRAEQERKAEELKARHSTSPLADEPSGPDGAPIPVVETEPAVESSGKAEESSLASPVAPSMSDAVSGDEAQETEEDESPDEDPPTRRVAAEDGRSPKLIALDIAPPSEDKPDLDTLSPLSEPPVSEEALSLEAPNSEALSLDSDALEERLELEPESVKVAESLPSLDDLVVTKSRPPGPPPMRRSSGPPGLPPGPSSLASMPPSGRIPPPPIGRPSAPPLRSSGASSLPPPPPMGAGRPPLPSALSASKPPPPPPSMSRSAPPPPAGSAKIPPPPLNRSAPPPPGNKAMAPPEVSASKAPPPPPARRPPPPPNRK